MALVVQKYGGSSIGSPERIRRVAERVAATRAAGHDVVVVASAMGDTTDELLDLAHQVSRAPGSARELDMLLTSGERISNALLAIALTDLGYPACSLSGPQAGVFTTPEHGYARIVDVLPTRVRQELDRGQVVLVAGFQGLCKDTDDVTTLGRGGSDTTAVALAGALHADVCEIYTDVDGVCTADPRVVPTARLLDRVPYAQMLELAAHGAKVLMPRSVEYARRHGVVVHVRSSFTDRPGTVVADRADQEVQMEKTAVTAVAHDRGVALVSVTGVPDDDPIRPARVFRVLANAGVEVDMPVHKSTRGRVDLSFAVARGSAPAAVAALHAAADTIGFAAVTSDHNVGTVSVVGDALTADITATVCETFAALPTRIRLLTTSELRISVLCPDTELDRAVRALHEVFELSTPLTGPPATVYAGTGRGW
ncbi:aspartate kinase [Actinokineospora globicatena]|uniref:aspartate kinase n=1 Tax=Actinokineospora globicatena TaxID=103729 RepID=UPI0020A4E97D|nr:aspartate kinase [Actinokineospora globicatena]MCP2306287.1 aspartate kinase [Actinokineospora globicatena]GLW81711.1 aspartokinase [Actinokineospora globicatena]GLW88506.1 aspartokinase [Actinokineospora globicatena]